MPHPLNKMLQELNICPKPMALPLHHDQTAKHPEMPTARTRGYHPNGPEANDAIIAALAAAERLCFHVLHNDGMAHCSLLVIDD